MRIYAVKHPLLTIFLIAGIGLVWLAVPLITRDGARNQKRVVGALKFVEERIETLGSGDQVVDAFHLPILQEGPEPNAWVVSGVVEMHDAAAGKHFKPYVAELTSVCNSYSDSRCWSLEKLDLGSELNEPDEDGARVSLMSALDLEAIEPALEAGAVEQASDRVPLIGVNSQADSKLSSQYKLIATTEKAGKLTSNSNEQTKKPHKNALDFLRNHQVLVYLIQRQLNGLGYNSGPADGKIGPRTRAAIEAYQREHNLRIDGRPTKKLTSHLAKSLLDLSPDTGRIGQAN